MGWNPPWPFWVYALMALLSLLLVPYWVLRSRRAGPWFTKTLILILRCAVIFLLLSILANPVVERAVSRETRPRRQLLLVDSSESMTLGTPQSRWEATRQVYGPLLYHRRFAGQLQLQTFDAVLHPADARGGPSAPRGERTLLGSALLDFLQTSAGGEWTDVIVFSDGRIMDRPQLARAVSWSRRMGIPISTCAVGERTVVRNLAIENCSVDRHAAPGSRLPLRVAVRADGVAGERCELSLVDDAQRECARIPFTATDGLQELDLVLALGKRGGDFALVLSPLANEISRTDNLHRFHVDVESGKLRVLYMEGSVFTCRPWNMQEYGFIERALEETGDIDCDVLIVDRQVTRGGRLYGAVDPSRGYPTTRRDLFSYDVVICSDINRFIFSEEQKQWTVELVSERGGGFCMVGGITSFSAGGWDQTSWDQLIPVDMADVTEGYVWEMFKVHFPPEARRHPILQLDPDPKLNDKILASIPTFFGTNLVRRAKPAATILGVHGDRNIPIFAVQPYGKGRTMAFMSDSTSNWGVYFETMWGTNFQDYRDLLPPGARPNVNYRPSPPSPAQGGENTYFKRFWVNIVRWLAENSTAQKSGTLLCNSERTTYRPGDEIHVRASLLDARGDPAAVQVSAHLRLPAAPIVPLAYHPERNEYVGSLSLPPETRLQEVFVDFSAQSPDETLRGESISVAVLHQKEEFRNPQPDPELLAELARATGGRTLTSSAELTQLLEARTAERQQPLRFRIPLWDSFLVWAAILGLLSLEWVVRRLVST